MNAPQPVTSLKPRRRRWKTILGAVLILLLMAAAWTTVSRNPYAQGVRAIFGRTPDQVIIDRTFTVGARGFRFYKFTVPEGTAHMAVAGQFSVSADAGDNAIEMSVLGEEQLAQWQAGTASQSIYESGRISQAIVQVELPRAGTYYLLFSNRFAIGGLKKVSARFVVRHKDWWR